MTMKRQNLRKLLLLFSFLFFPITLYYFSPALIINGSFAGVAAGSLFVFLLQFAFSLVLGRAFCGWVCPAGGLQECWCTQAVNKPVRHKWVNAIKYVIWAPWLLTIILGFVRAGGIRQVDFFYMTTGGVSVADFAGLIIYLLLTLLVAVVALAVGRRGMCHTLCWMAPFMVLGTRLKNLLHLPGLRLKAEPDACIQCGKCTAGCPMSLPVAQMVKAGQMQNDECILCGNCADVCPKSAVHLGFGR